jgi:TolB-like protein/class 3 adenylate cyclase/Flp pilus assembly protein TadD
MRAVSGAALLSQYIEIERRLAAVLAADVAGFSRLTEADEIGTMRMLAGQRAILDSAISRHRGRIANTAGDSVLAEFPSAVNAVQCAVEAQQALRDAAEGAPADRRVMFRIGIHVGDVMVRGGDLLGSGVNVAARLEALADAGGIVLSSAAHEQVKKILPLAYTDLGPQSVKNIEEPVRAFAIGAAASAVAFMPGEGKPLPLPDKPSIAVLPFQNMSGDPEQEYFADGMVEDIISALSRNSGLFVIARNSSFTYKGKAVDIKQVGRELGVRYVLEGSVRKAGGRVRITGQLIEAHAGTHLWADKFDSMLDDLFDLQDRVTSSVVSAIYPQLELAEIRRSQSKPTESMRAYDYYLRAIAELYKFTRDGNLEIARLTGIATQIDPNFAVAYALAAISLAQRRAFGWIVDAAQEQADARRLAQQALSLESENPLVLANAGMVHSYALKEVEYGAALLSRSIDLDPNFVSARYWFGQTQMWLGQLDAAIDTFQKALRLSPLDSRRFLAQNGSACAHLLAGRHDDALSWAKATTQLRPNFPFGQLALGASLAALGRFDEARSAIALVTRLDPELTISNYAARVPWRSPEIDRLKQLFRIAGLPE